MMARLILDPTRYASQATGVERLRLPVTVVRLVSYICNRLDYRPQGYDIDWETEADYAGDIAYERRIAANKRHFLGCVVWDDIRASCTCANDLS